MTEIEDHSDYSVLVYKHNDLELVYENNFKRIVTTNDIKSGQLLALEHVYAAKPEICCRIIENNEKLFDTYHPRALSHAESKERFMQAREKLSHNCFGLMDGNNIINIFIHQINHSCDASCAVYIQENHTFDETKVIFMELYSVRNITKGNEITINYGPDTAHKRDFECKCGKDDAERHKVFTVTANLAYAISTMHSDIIQKKLYEYLQLPLAKKILLNQYLAVNGIYVSNNTIVGFDTNGAVMINNVVRKCMKITDPLLCNETINPVKLGLFMQILNESIIDKPSMENI